MKNWLRDPHDKDLVTTIQMARGWEASTIVLILNNDEPNNFENKIMRAVTKGRRVKKEFTILSSKLKMKICFEISFWIKSREFFKEFFNLSLFS